MKNIVNLIEVRKEINYSIYLIVLMKEYKEYFMEIILKLMSLI